MALVLVTGGGGFLGGAIVRRLLARGDRVRGFARGEYPALSAAGVKMCRGDLSDDRAVIAACKECDVVFHVAARAGIWGRAEAFHASNVRGTENVLTGCLRHGVARLIHTSSPSVVFDDHDQEGVDESVPYPARYSAHYPRTKAAAERLILAAHGARLRTIALRPHLIWGPGDNHLVPRILARARAGRLRRIGAANKRIDSTYIDNAADAHLCAADRLAADPTVGGRAYFISNGEPMPLWDLVNAILATAGLPPVTRRVPRSIARMAGTLCEIAYQLTGAESEPPMTRFLADELSTAHWFDLTAARRDLGYQPSVTIAEGLKHLRESQTAGGRLQS